MTILFCKFVEALFLFLKCFVKGKNFTSFFFEVKKISQDLLEGKILQVFVVEKNFASVSPKRKKSFCKSFE